MERRRRATDELLEQIQKGQNQLIEELTKPQREAPVNILLRYSAYIIPIVVALVTIINVIKTSELEINHLKERCAENKSRIEKIDKLAEDTLLWNKEVQLTLEKLVDDHSQYMSGLTKMETKMEGIERLKTIVDNIERRLTRIEGRP